MSTRTTHFITTAPTGTTWFAIRLPGLRLLELVSEDGTQHRTLTPEQARELGFGRCRPCNGGEMERADLALTRWRRAHSAALQAAQPVTGWREVQHDGRTWWARELPSGALEAVSPAGDALITITTDLAPGRAVDAERARAALRTYRAFERGAFAKTETRAERERRAYAADMERRGYSAWA